MRNVTDYGCRKYLNVHFMFNNVSFEKRADYELKWKKYFRAGQATDNSVGHAHCRLDT